MEALNMGAMPPRGFWNKGAMPPGRFWNKGAMPPRNSPTSEETERRFWNEGAMPLVTPLLQRRPSIGLGALIGVSA